MDMIDPKYFNYSFTGCMICPSEKSDTQQKERNMKTYRTTFALAAAGLLALVAAVAGVRSPDVGVEGVVGFAVVGAILGFAALDYRLGGRVFSNR